MRNKTKMHLACCPRQLSVLGIRGRQLLDRQMGVYKSVLMTGGEGGNPSACSPHFQEDQSNDKFQQLR